MRKIFLIWLLVFMMSAFIAVISVSFYVQTNQASQNSKMLINLKIDDLSEQNEISINIIKNLCTDINFHTEAKTSILKMMLK